MGSQPPHRWGNDEITGFFDEMRENCFGTYVRLRPEYTKLAEVDALFRKAIGYLNNPKDSLIVLFFVRSHAAYLGGVQFAMAGQGGEVCAPLRLCLENGLYGLYLTKNPDSQKIWWERNDSERARSRARKEFKTAKLFHTLKEADTREARVAEKLYEDCIDLGAHPNQLALVQNLRVEDGSDIVKFHAIYLNDDPLVYRLCLTTAARVGTSVLGIFRLVFKERFEITGMSEQLEQVRQGL